MSDTEKIISLNEYQWARVTADCEGSGHVRLSFGSMDGGEWFEHLRFEIEPEAAFDLGRLLEFVAENRDFGGGVAQRKAWRSAKASCEGGGGDFDALVERAGVVLDQYQERDKAKSDHDGSLANTDGEKR